MFRMKGLEPLALTTPACVRMRIDMLWLNFVNAFLESCTFCPADMAHDPAARAPSCISAPCRWLYSMPGVMSRLVYMDQDGEAIASSLHLDLPSSVDLNEALAVGRIMRRRGMPVEGVLSAIKATSAAPHPCCIIPAARRLVTASFRRPVHLCEAGLFEQKRWSSSARARRHLGACIGVD